VFQKFAHLASIACALSALALMARAADAPMDGEGSHDVKVRDSKGRVVTLRVQDAPSPYANVSHSVTGTEGKYDPEALDFSKASPMASKTFSMGTVNPGGNDQATEAREGRTFQTKSFLPEQAVSGGSMPDANRTFDTGAAFDFGHRTNESSKTFSTRSADLGATQTFGGIKTSPLQDKTALVAETNKPALFADAEFSNKAFDDPELRHVRRDPYANGMDVSRMVHLPDRPLTIDEVRELINHEVVPDTDKPADDQSKALNDPQYVPPASPPFPTVAPAAPPVPATAHRDQDDSDVLPSPGMMATPEPPENSEPLPKK
jgi:hypothetical protein